jgi:hypothetical protein
MAIVKKAIANVTAQKSLGVDFRVFIASVRVEMVPGSQLFFAYSLL